MKYIVFYNPLSDNSNGWQNAQKVKAFYPDDQLEFVDSTQNDYQQIIDQSDVDAFVLVGGDGTLNYFVNAVDCDNLTKDIFYFAGGSGNDFLTDLGGKKGDQPILLNPYVEKLPIVHVNGITRKFINGIGYGIDGYCCEVADKIRAKTPGKRIDYTGIAIKGCLFHYKPTTATITVDGETKVYKKAWLAPSMNGRFYGGGMNACPNQNRLGDGSLSVMTMFGKGRLGTLIMFPSIFKGEHVKYTKNTAIRSGFEINVKFDRAVALQIDGETVLGVTEYTAVGTKR